METGVILVSSDRGLTIQHQGWKLDVDRDWDGTVFIGGNRITLDVERFAKSEGFNDLKQYDVYLRAIQKCPLDDRLEIERLKGTERLFALFRRGFIDRDTMNMCQLEN